VAKAGSHQEVTPVYLCQIDGAPQCIQVSTANFQGGNADSFDAGCGMYKRQVVYAFFDQQRRGELTICRREQSRYALRRFLCEGYTNRFDG
jgi:hypothetical protein